MHISIFFFFNDTATTEIYTLSLHDALPICFSKIAFPGLRVGWVIGPRPVISRLAEVKQWCDLHTNQLDRKSTRLNSSHVRISYAVFCLKKKKKNTSKNVPQSLNICRN